MKFAYRFEQMLAMSRHASDIVAEVRFLLVVIAGLWLVASEIPALKMAKTRRIAASRWRSPAFC